MTKLNNKVKINNNVVSKKTDKSVLELYEYLNSIDFNNYPKVISYENGILNSEYIVSKPYHEMTKCEEEMKLVSKLHSKTMKLLDISKNKYNKIYSILKNNIEYLKKYYNDIISEIEKEVFMSPSHYLIARNYSLIDYLLEYSSDSLEKWNKLIENKTTERVCLIHNNLSQNHFIKGDKDYLISFDNAMVDTPILDLYKFYKNEAYRYNFKYLLKVYEENVELYEEEKLLLYILIAMPLKIEKISDEYQNTININYSFKYMCSSLKMINDK